MELVKISRPSRTGRRKEAHTLPDPKNIMGFYNALSLSQAMFMISVTVSKPMSIYSYQRPFWRQSARALGSSQRTYRITNIIAGHSSLVFSQHVDRQTAGQTLGDAEIQIKLDFYICADTDRQTLSHGLSYWHPP